MWFVRDSGRLRRYGRTRRLEPGEGAGGGARRRSTLPKAGTTLRAQAAELSSLKNPTSTAAQMGRSETTTASEKLLSASYWKGCDF